MLDWDNFVSRMEEEKRREAVNPPRKHKKLQIINSEKIDKKNPKICTSPQNLRKTRSIGKHSTCVAEQSAHPSVAAEFTLSEDQTHEDILIRLS